MTKLLKLMGIFAHPDDESLGNGGTLARYAAEGVQVSLVVATRGERGWTGPDSENPGLEALGRIRESELRAAAHTLGVGSVAFLNYIDGDLDQASPAEAIARITAAICRERPQVVLTFAGDGAYGHPDHIAISQFTTAALVCAADSSYTATLGFQPHRVSKLYYMALDRKKGDVYLPVFGDLMMGVDGVERGPVVWQEWAITTRIDGSQYWEKVWSAVACHRSQLTNYDILAKLSEQQHQDLWCKQGYYRVFSLVNGGRRPETDLFEGLR